MLTVMKLKGLTITYAHPELNGLSRSYIISDGVHYVKVLIDVRLIDDYRIWDSVATRARRLLSGTSGE